MQTPTVAGTPATDATSIYKRLAEPFPREVLHHDRRGGAEFDYITGEQCVTRLNDTLGPGGWYFKIIEHSINTEADETWCLGEMGALIDDQWVVRQQFGSQKIKRSRASGAPLDIGFDLKGAATDCLKKCATLFGVALHLYEKEPPHSDEDRQTFTCAECGQALQQLSFSQQVEGGQPRMVTWSAGKLAEMSRKKYTKVLCETHYKAANRKLREAQPQTQGAS